MMRERTKGSADRSAERLKRMARGYWDSSILRTLISLGLCPILNESSATAVELASRVGANPRFLDSFLGACVALGLLERHGERYSNSQQAAAFLIPGFGKIADDSPLWDAPNFHVSPFLAALDPREWERAADLFARNLRAFIENRTLENEIDVSTY